MKACINCKFCDGGGLFGLIEPRCHHPNCVDKGFIYKDEVTGQTRIYKDEPMLCYKARWSACGSSGRFWEQK